MTSAQLDSLNVFDWQIGPNLRWTTSVIACLLTEQGLIFTQ